MFHCLIRCAIVGMACCRPYKTALLVLVCCLVLVTFVIYSDQLIPFSDTISITSRTNDRDNIHKIGSKWIQSLKKKISVNFETISKQKGNGSEEIQLNVCPEKPKELVGQIKTLLNPVDISAVESKYPQVTKGGNYRPPDCKPRERLALIIPCRDRTEHLHILLNNLLGMLIKQKVHFTIFVIDQEKPTTFNRGMLFNVGYLEALKRGHYDCFILHDVDMIPTNDNCLYKCNNNPKHFLSGVSKWNYGLPYHGYYGGVVSFTRDQYQKINGDSNLYFGWGGEDDDLRARILNKGYSLVRYPKFIGRYDTVSHKRDSGNKENPARFHLVTTAKARQDVDGLSTTKYTVTEVKEEKLYTKIKVFINMLEIIATAPPEDRRVMNTLQKDALAFDAATKGKFSKSPSSSQQPIKRI